MWVDPEMKLFKLNNKKHRNIFLFVCQPLAESQKSGICEFGKNHINYISLKLKR